MEQILRFAANVPEYRGGSFGKMLIASGYSSTSSPGAQRPKPEARLKLLSQKTLKGKLKNPKSLIRQMELVCPWWLALIYFQDHLPEQQTRTIHRMGKAHPTAFRAQNGGYSEYMLAES